MITKTVPSWCEKKNKVLLLYLPCAVLCPAPCRGQSPTSLEIFNDTKNSSKTHRDRCSDSVAVTFTQGVGNVHDEVIVGMWITARAGVCTWNEMIKHKLYQVIALYTFVVTSFSEYFALVTYNGMVTTNDKEKLVFYLKCSKYFAELLIKHLAVNCLISSIL